MVDMSGPTFLVIQVGNSNGNKFSLCKTDSYNSTFKSEQPRNINGSPYERKLVLMPDAGTNRSANSNIRVKSLDVLQKTSNEVVPPSAVDLRVSPEPTPKLSPMDDVSMDASEKYQRIKQQNCSASKRNRMRKKSLSCSESSNDECGSEGSRHSRCPRMDLSQLDDAAKYKRIRELNNLASKRLREKKRKQLKNVSEELDELNVENTMLKTQLTNLESATKELRAMLLQQGALSII